MQFGALGRRSRWRRWLDAALSLFWYIQPQAVMTVDAGPERCVVQLTEACRPRIQSLHLRDLYVNGRRYQLTRLKSGFRLTTSSRVIWNPRRRSKTLAVMHGSFSESRSGSTQIQLRARISPLHLLDTFIVPSILTSIILFVPWPLTMIGSIIIAVFTLSWVTHRAAAALEVNEMLFFVHKTLEALVHAEAPTLRAQTPAVIYDSPSFTQEWVRHIRQQRSS